jgi:Tol biopolymer transport system component
MTLSIGSRLGPYEILAPLGAGGMGEVYRARDTRLSREVAVKVLPSQRTPTPEARERFEREARTISQLSHPNICVLHDVGREGDTEYLVMELVEGETLSDRLARGPLPLDQALRFGAEIAAALDAAHRKGIVHRDLKPGNVMLTKSGVKLLDFGLARAFDAPAAVSDVTAAPTMARALTSEGVIVGTVSYMSPEQLEGKAPDARSDTFALGVVLYEMLTGRRAFSGASQATVITAIMTTEPAPISEQLPLSPPELDRLVRICLAKDPSNRWQSAHDVELQLRSIGASGAVARVAPGGGAPGRRRAARLPWAAAAACAAIAALALYGGRRVRAPESTIRFSVLRPENGEFQYLAEGNFLAVSPDGSQLAYVASDPKGGRRVWIRPLSALSGRSLPGTEGANSILWSPDGRSIAFFTRDKLKRIDPAGGAAVPICDIPMGGGGKAGTWGRADILFSAIQGGALYRVPASGGQPTVEIQASLSQAQLRLGWPWFLPDGERYMYLVRESDGWGNLMLAEPGKKPRAVTRLASFFQYVDPGYLVFSHESTLLAQRFDLKTARVSGDPVPVADHVRYFYSTGSAAFAARGGTIAYQSENDASRLAWFDRTGREGEVLSTPGGYLDVSLAGDGKRVLFSRTRPGLETYHVWSYDLERGVETAVTTGLDTEAFPHLLADGRTLVFSAVRGTPPLLTRRDLATGKEDPLTPESRVFQMPQDVSPDGRTLLYVERTATGSFDIWTLALEPGGKVAPLLQSPFGKTNVRFSPDGRYVAFLSLESGGEEAYVMPFPGPGERVRVSKGGAGILRWSRSGEILYLSFDGHFVSVPIRTSPTLQIGAPTTLFTVGPIGRTWNDFDVTPDGQRFLAIVPEVIGNESPLNVIVHWAPEGAKP